MADPIADPDEAARAYGRAPIALSGSAYDVVVAAVAHDKYRALDDNRLLALVSKDGKLADLKRIWRGRELAASIDRWVL